jgi:transposase
VHVKTLRIQKLRILLTHRKLLQFKAIAVDNDLRGTLRNFGLKVGIVGQAKFEARIKELVDGLPDSLTYRATVDVPARFRHSKSVGAVFELTPSRDQSGEHDHPGAISRCCDEMMALRGSAEHADAFVAMVLAQGLGDEDRQVSRHEKSHRRIGPPAGGDHAPHLG